MGLLEKWPTVRVLGIMVIGILIAAALLSHKAKPFWFLLEQVLARYSVPSLLTWAANLIFV